MSDIALNPKQLATLLEKTIAARHPVLSISGEGEPLRTFEITDLFIGNSNLKVTVKNYRWTRRTGLQCEMRPDTWVKSEYNLREFLSDMNGTFIETTPKGA